MNGFIVVGISYRTAAVEVRERFAVPERRLPEALGHLKELPGLEEALLLSTCNRVELYAKVADTETGLAAAQEFFRRFLAATEEDFARHFYGYSSGEAVQHVFRVAASLDSMVVGEPQILGQVKDAYHMARAAGTLRRDLDQLFTQAFTVAKRIRNETEIASAAVSVPFAAVELAKKIFGPLEKKTILVIGAGEMGELAARHLVSNGASTVLVTNRTYERAVELARELGGLAVRYDDRWDYLAQADIVISSTGCPYPIFSRTDGERLRILRRNRPVFFIDIAVPRDIDPAVNRIDNFFLYDIDDLEQVVIQNFRERQKAAETAEKIVRKEVAAFAKERAKREVVPTIVSLRQHLGEIRRCELERFRNRLGPLTLEQEEALEVLTQSIINKILHTPVTELKSAAAEQRSELVRVVETIFDLKPQPTATPAGEALPVAAD